MRKAASVGTAGKANQRKTQKHILNFSGSDFGHG